MSNLRDQVSDAARAIFIAEGIDGISMRRIAAEVGVTAPAIYRNFKNKDDLIDSLVNEGFAMLETQMQRGADG